MTGEENRDAAVPRRPVTYHEASGIVAHQARDRYHELDNRDLQARAIATLKARGTYDPARHGDPAKYPLLTIEEHLERLALGENLARFYRHPATVDHALKAGATWEQVAAARGTDEATARREYRAWADVQHWLWRDYEGKFGMDDAEHAAAIERAGLDQDAGPGLSPPPPLLFACSPAGLCGIRSAPDAIRGLSRR